MLTIEKPMFNSRSSIKNGCLAAGVALALAGGASAKEIAVIEVENQLVSSNADKAFELLQELDFRNTEAVILQVNCFAPMSWNELDLMMKGLARLPIPSFAYVDAIAVDAGAWLALATDKIYMAPSGIIGGSPVAGTSTMTVKSESFSQGAVRSVVAQKQHRPDLADAFMNPEVEFTWRGETLSTKGDRLILRASQAVQEDEEGRPLLAAGIADSVYEIREIEGLQGSFRFLNATDPRPQTESAFVSRIRTKEPSYAGKIVVIPIRKQDLMNTARFDFTRRTLLKVEHEKASAVILDINTPGGYAMQTAHLANLLTKLKVPSYAYINPSAVSAGALLSLATDTIYMHPVSAIGAAAVVTPMGDLTEDLENQFNAVFVPLFKAVSEANGHAPVYAEKFIRVDRTKPAAEDASALEETGMPEPEAQWGIPELENEGADEDKLDAEALGSLLTLSATEAISEWEGQPPLAKGIAASLQDLIEKEGLKGEVIVAEPLGFEKLAQWVTQYASILLLLAFGLGFIEMRTPGFGVFGLTSLAIFALFFFGHFVAGKLVGMEMVALFVIGVGLILVEIFVFPGTLIAGVAGAGLIVIALVHTMADAAIGPSGDLSPWLIDIDSLGAALTQLSIAVLGTIALGLLSTRFLGESRAFKELVLHEAVAHGPGVTGGAAAIEEEPLVGRIVVCHSDLRPAGKVMVDGRVRDAATRGEFVDGGSRVEILRIEGASLIVRALTP